MKKVLMVLVCGAIAMSLAGMAYATDAKTTDTVKTKVTEKAGTTTVKEKEVIKTGDAKEVIKTEVKSNANEVVTKETDKIKAKEGKEVLKEKEVVTNAGKAVDANVTAKFKKGDIAKEKVQFVSYSEENGGTIIVIKDKKEVRMPATNHANWKNNVLTKKNKEVTIHSTYDPKLNKTIVTHVE